VNYTPKGKNVDLGGVTVYQVGTGSKALVLFEDIFGIDSGRHKTVADTYAALGFRVYLPEFLEPVYKGSIEDVPKILEVVQAQKISTIKAKYEKLSAHIKSEGSETFLAAAFCWGAWTAFRMSADYNNIRAIAGVHPSLNVENFYGGNEVKLV
jgi:dienelactone hydrolase